MQCNRKNEIYRTLENRKCLKSNIHLLCYCQFSNKKYLRPLNRASCLFRFSLMKTTLLCSVHNIPIRTVALLYKVTIPTVSESNWPDSWFNILWKGFQRFSLHIWRFNAEKNHLRLYVLSRTTWALSQKLHIVWFDLKESGCPYLQLVFLGQKYYFPRNQ